MREQQQIPLIIIEGPTGSGKSSIAHDLAKKLKSEIISADSRQIYRYMDIGTAKPSKKAREEIPHHLIDIIDPNTEYSAGNFANDAALVIDEIYDRKEKTANEENPLRIPVIAGGTGFYIQALLEGLCQAPPVNEEIRREVDSYEREKGTEYLYSVLKKVDPEAAERIHSNDNYRLKRSLEVWIATGKPMSAYWSEQKKQNNRYNAFRIYLDRSRDELYLRINRRMESMIEQGLIDEIRSLLEMGYKCDDPGLNSVGYKEYLPFILENQSFIECLEKAKQNTRNYAKRQITWYRKRHFDLKLDPAGTKIDKVYTEIKNYFASTT